MLLISHMRVSSIFSYQEVLVVNAEPLSEVSKHQGTVLLELEMAWHVLSVHVEKQRIRVKR